MNKFYLMVSFVVGSVFITMIVFGFYIDGFLDNPTWDKEGLLIGLWSFIIFGICRKMHRNYRLYKKA